MTEVYGRGTLIYGPAARRHAVWRWPITPLPFAGAGRGAKPGPRRRVVAGYDAKLGPAAGRGRSGDDRQGNMWRLHL